MSLTKKSLFPLRGSNDTLVLNANSVPDLNIEERDKMFCVQHLAKIKKQLWHNFLSTLHTK